MSNKLSRKKCLVPCCTHTAHRNPEKYFIGVPRTTTQEKKELRQAWLQAMGLPVDHLRDFTKGHYVCEDHFNLKEDMDNYYDVQLMNFGYYRCKPGVIPSRNLTNIHPPAEERNYGMKQEAMGLSSSTYPHIPSSTARFTRKGVEIVYEKSEENEIPSVITENILQGKNIKDNSQQINISKSNSPSNTLERFKNSLQESISTNNFVFSSNSNENPIESNKGTLTNTLKRKEISTNTLHISDNEIEDILSKRIKIKSYSQYCDSSDSEDNKFYKPRKQQIDKDWEICDDDEADLSGDDKYCTFKYECLEITRINHKKSWEKYFGLPSDCYWVIDSLANELRICINNRYMIKRDYVELILRKMHLNENFYILCDYFGIQGETAKRIYFKYSKGISEALHSIGIDNI